MTHEELNQIYSADADAFSFVDVAGSFIQNKTFSEGLRHFQVGENDQHETFIYQVLSSASGDIGKTIYDNVKRYISYVADVDVCKVKSLKSMLNLFGFKYTIFDKLVQIPQEILQLIDVLSINRKFLLKDGWLKPEFIQLLSADGVVAGNALEDSILDLRHLFTRNGYILSSCPCLSSTMEANKTKILGTYLQQDTKQTLAGTPLSDWASYEGVLSSSALFKNNYNYLILDQLSSYNLYNDQLSLVLKFPETEINQLTTNGASACYQISALSGDEDDLDLTTSEFIRVNQDQHLGVQFRSFFREDVQLFDDDSYQLFLENVYFKLISSYIALPYNLETLKGKKLTSAPIYPDLGSDYYRSFTSLRDYKGFDEDDMLSVESFFHVSRSFDRRGIVDRIEIGDDDLDNYSGAELSILNYEIQRRNSQVDLSTLTARGYSAANANLFQTRASYYRKLKVLEYARFVDNYYSDTAGDPSVYELDPNYYMVSSDVSQISTVISQTPSGDPKTDIRYGMIHDVALHLAKLTTYIQKIREKVKQQTQKNYMKGTNLLLVYIINEYLLDYAKHNQKKLYDAGLSGIYAKLSAHQFKESEDTESYTINPVEFYDETNYNNISASTSKLSRLSSSVNPRFWIPTSQDSKGLLKDDGECFSIDRIEKFYLSTLNLNSKLSGNLPNFLSTIFELGADPTFIYELSNDSHLSIFSSALSNGQFAHELFEELINLSSSWLSYRNWLGDEYEYKDGDTALAQLSDSLANSIYVNLSAKHLANVSAAYNANISSVLALSSSVDQLSSSYNSFITSDYAFYYKKFESKYCYEDHDPDAGTYKHPWYVGNDEFDQPEMSLYEHLYQLDRYSDGSKIVNWALSDIIAYVDDGFNSTYNALRSQVISKITQYGFVDINALTLDGELTYTYDFLNNLVQSRKEFLKEQLASLQQQASSLKTQYETLNNTFTNAVASFQDGNEGYNLGDDKIYAVSMNKASGFDGQCSRDDKKPSKGPTKFCVFVNGYWYFGKDGGDFAYEIQNVSPVYEADGTLRQRCDAVKAYMAAPTYFVVVDGEPQYFYGLQNEGIAAVTDNTIVALDGLNDTYDNICGMAANLFGLNVTSESSDLYQNILGLIESLVAIDETFFDEDENISIYKDYIKKVITLSSQYLPIKEAYDDILKSSELGSYMMNFIPAADLTRENISNLRRYLKKTDSSNLEQIRTKIQEFYSQFDKLLATKDNLELCVYNAGVSGIGFTDGNMIEQYVYNIYNGLLADVDRKTNIANSIIDFQKEQIQSYADIISDEVSANLESTNGISNIVTDRLTELNFFDGYNYYQNKQLFQTYGGRSFCYDPYYNIQNKVHPSYQIHPYLWNFVRKMNSDSLIQSGFQAKAVNELEEDLVNSYITKYLNKQGMPIDLWLNTSKGLVDYTGYLSRYEMSENFSPATGLQNEVVDYDGAFYPPAISTFRANSFVCINSVSSEVTKARCLVLASRSLPEEISSAVEVGTDEAKTIISESFYSDVAKSLTSWLDVSVENIKRVIDEKIVGQPLSCATTAAIINALDAFLPSTFFEKYYKHLNLPATEYQRIARQLTEYSSQIKSITNPLQVTDVYDIYKYGLDLNGNSYILYKQYDYSKVEELKDMSFSLKRNTPGEMWIRLANHPIAFPAFTGQNPAYYLQNPKLVNMSILSVAAKEDPQGIVWADEDHLGIQQISSRMKVFYDFEMSKGKSSIAYMTINGDYPLIDAYKRFDLAWVIGNQVQTYYDQTTDLEWLQILNNGGAGIERIDFNYNSSLGQHYVGLDVLSTSSVNYPALIGCYPIEDSGIDFVYLEKEFGISGDISSGYQISAATLSSPTMFAVKIQDGTTYLKTSEQIMVDVVNANQKIVGDAACVGYDNDQEQTILAVTTKTIDNRPNLLDTCTTSGKVDFDKNSEGPTISDPLGFEMNSHDYFSQNVTIAKFRRRPTKLQFKEATVHNLNADISYIPSYPALSNEAKIYAKWPDDEWHNIELLGRSKDIDDAIKLVNPNPNPYLDYEKITEDLAFGRVYEDYNPSEDKTFKVISNPALNPNSPRDCDGLEVSYSSGDDYLEYSIPLAEFSRKAGSQYSDKDYDNLKILVHNKNTLGKDPYLVCDLKALDGQVKELAYSDENSQLGEVSVLVPDTERNEYYAVGTHESFELKTRSDSNRFRNISKITCTFSKSSAEKILAFKFYIQDKAFPFSIPKGSFDVLLHNPYDLTMFKYYHFLDAYGAVNCGFLATRPDFIGKPDDGRGWGIYYDPSKIDLDKYLDDTKSFIVDDSGLTTFLKDIELSDYNYLSDIYVLSGYKGLGFKYDEELRFAVSSDLYYYPTMNLSYPKQAADYVQAGQLVAGSSIGELSVLKSIYDGTNLFVLDLDDPKAIADKLGKIAIPVSINNVDDLRAYEDWLDTSSFISTFIEDGVEKTTEIEMKFSEIYDASDPRAFKWLRYASEVKSTGSELTSDGYLRKEYDQATNTEVPFDVSDSSWDHAFADKFTDDILIAHNLVPMTSEELTSDYQSEYVFVDMNSKTVDLEKMLKLYVNYKKNADDNTIDLYFNYFNWFNTPYVKIVDNKTYIDTIPETYLKLKSGEDGMLDIIIQVKYYNGDELYGYKNIKVLGYHIWNLSDDKPKFLVQKVYELQKDSQGIDISEPSALINLNSVEIELDGLEANTKPDIPVWMTIASNVELSGECEFYLNYPGEILCCQPGNYGSFMVEDDTTGVAGLSKIHIYNTKVKTCQLPFKSILKTSDLAASHRNTGLYIAVDDPSFFSEDGRSCNVDSSDCVVTFNATSQVVLSNKPNGSGSLVLAGSTPEKVILTQN